MIATREDKDMLRFPRVSDAPGKRQTGRRVIAPTNLTGGTRRRSSQVTRSQTVDADQQEKSLPTASGFSDLAIVGSPLILSGES
jgi:hypothetical protein